MAKFKWRTLLFAKKYMRDIIYRLTVKMGESRFRIGFLMLTTIVHVTGWDILHLRRLSWWTLCCNQWFLQNWWFDQRGKKSLDQIVAQNLSDFQFLLLSLFMSAANWVGLLLNQHQYLTQCWSCHICFPLLTDEVYHPNSRRITLTLKACLCMYIILTVLEQW